MTARKPPVVPFSGGPTLHDLRVGDKVRVTLSGRTGTVLSRCKQKRDGWVVSWDEPVFGRTQGRVAWANLEPVE